MKIIVIILIIFLMMGCSVFDTYTSIDSMKNGGELDSLLLKDKEGNYYKLHYNMGNSYFVESLSKTLRETEEKIEEF